MPLGPLLSWKRADIWAATQRLWVAAAIAIVFAIAAAAWQSRGPWLAPLGVALGVWIIAGAVYELVSRSNIRKAGAAVAWARVKGMPGATWGMLLAHAGLGVMVIGIVAITAWKQEVVTVLKPGDTMQIGGRSVTFTGESPVTGPNYSAERGNFRITTPSGATADVSSEKRVFKPSNQPTTEVGIQPYLDGDVYVVIGDRAGETGRTVRAYFHPLVWMIWLGAALMFMGGFASILDRRYRVGAPKKSSAVAVQPAE